MSLDGEPTNAALARDVRRTSRSCRDAYLERRTRRLPNEPLSAFISWRKREGVPTNIVEVQPGTVVAASAPGRLYAARVYEVSADDTSRCVM